MKPSNELNNVREDLLWRLDLPLEYDTYDGKPIYVSFFDNLEDNIKFNRFFLYLFVALLPYLIYFLFSFTFGWEHEKFSDYWIRLNFSGWAFGSFLFMNYIYSKTTSVFPLLSYLADTAYNKHQLVLLYDKIFISHWQNRVCTIVGILTTVTGTYLDMNLPLAPKIYIIINSFFVGYIIGFGLWYSIGLAILIRSVGNMQNVKINYLNPSYSIGIYEIPRLASIWSMCFFGEAIIVYVGLLFPNWSVQSHITNIIQLFWLIIFLILAIYNFIHPISAISKLTNDAKTKFKLIVLDRLHESLGKVEKNIENIGEYYKEINIIEGLYEKISLSKSYLFDWAILFRFLATSIPTIIIIFLEHYRSIKELLNIF